MEFIKEPNRIYAEGEEKKLLAEVTFPQANENTVIINHTFVDDSLRGQGIADQLLSECVSYLSSENKLAIPTCSYAVRWFEKHPEYSNLLAKQ